MAQENGLFVENQLENCVTERRIFCDIQCLISSSIGIVDECENISVQTDHKLVRIFPYYNSIEEISYTSKIFSDCRPSINLSSFEKVMKIYLAPVKFTEDVYNEQYPQFQYGTLIVENDRRFFMVHC